jgi:AraC-like DNA-binding protein
MAATPEDLTDCPATSAEETPASGTAELLAGVLAQLHLSSSIFLRAEYRDPWAYESPASHDLCSVLQPGAERLILFHIVASGRCWVEVDGGSRLELEQGDIIVLPYADVHRMGGFQPATPVPIGSLLPPPPWMTLPVIRHGGNGDRTDVVCGYLHCDDLLFDPVLRALPPLFAVRPPPGPAAAWVSASMQYALQASQQGGTSGLAARLPELLFAEVLRLHVATRPPSSTGWLSAIHDPVVGPALRALHADPMRRWTVRVLAHEVATSRTVLDNRFRSVLGRPPMRYLTQWRLQLAARLLGATRSSISEIAYQVGYESEASFTRAYKRYVGLPPARWRDSHHRHEITASLAPDSTAAPSTA